jgi:hypothetical protein
LPRERLLRIASALDELGKTAGFDERLRDEVRQAKRRGYAELGEQPALVLKRLAIDRNAYVSCAEAIAESAAGNRTIATSLRNT